MKERKERKEGRKEETKGRRALKFHEKEEARLAKYKRTRCSSIGFFTKDMLGRKEFSSYAFSFLWLV